MTGRAVRRKRRRQIRGKPPGPSLQFEEQAFGALVSKFLKGALMSGDPDLTMTFFSQSWREQLPEKRVTRDLPEVGPYLLVTRFRKLVDGLNTRGFAWSVKWLKQRFSYKDWELAVKWSKIEMILGLFASRPSVEELENTHSKLQSYGLSSQERGSLRFEWLLKILKYEKAQGKLWWLENNETLTRKDVVEEFKGLTWLKKQKCQGQTVEWRWLVLLLQTAQIKSDVVIPACHNAPVVGADQGAKSRIWSAYATVHGIFTQLPAPWKTPVPVKADKVSDVYRLWWLGRAIACETKRMFARAGGSGSETLTVHYEYQGPKTFQAVEGDLTRKEVDDYYKKLVTEVGLLLQYVRVESDPVAEVVKRLQKAGDQCGLYNKLVVPGKAATAGWSDLGKLASSSFANYMSEEQRLELLEALGEVVMMATEKRMTGKVGRAKKILHILAGRKADPAEMLAAKAYVDGDISTGQKDRLLSGGFLPKLGHKTQNFFEEHSVWVLGGSVFLFLLGEMNLGVVPAVIGTWLLWKVVLKPLSMTRWWWVSTLIILGLLFHTIGGSGAVRINWGKIPNLIFGGGESGGSIGGGIDLNKPAPTPAP